MHNNKHYYLGVEGGGTSTTFAIVTSSGEIINIETIETSTNPLLVGPSTVAQIVNQFISNASTKYEFSLPISGIALSLSGVDNKEIQQQLRTEFSALDTRLTETLFLCNDSVGSAGLLPNSSFPIVLIAGTGSHCRAVLPSGEEYRSGGWGHLLSEHGCGYDIVASAVAECLRQRDYHPDASKHSCTLLQELLLHHFSLSDLPDILSMFYRSFNKGKIAELAKDISNLARKGDPLSISLFQDAGKELGKMLVAVLSQLDNAGHKVPAVDVLAVGSMWKSFDLIESEFLKYVNAQFNVGLSIFKPKITAAVGAVLLMTKEERINIGIDTSLLVELLDI
ncbi:hypothetical protein P9112_011072 [Eukaryota sp. TZLM1-RC]